MGKAVKTVLWDGPNILETMEDYQKHAVIIYFMGKTLKGMQLQAWAEHAMGPGSVRKFIFMGKGFYTAVCSDVRHKYKLVDAGGVWGNGHFALAMPWYASFDPMKALLTHCPVWVVFKEVPSVFLPYMDYLAGCLGKVLYLPPQAQFVCSTNVKVCLLWDMNQPVPAALKLELGKQQNLFIEISFHSFPNACYRCRQIGHYAKECPSTHVVGPNASHIEKPSDIPQSSSQNGSTQLQAMDGCVKLVFKHEQELSSVVKSIVPGTTSEMDEGKGEYASRDTIMHGDRRDDLLDHKHDVLIVKRKKIKRKKNKGTADKENLSPSAGEQQKTAHGLGNTLVETKEKVNDNRMDTEVKEKGTNGRESLMEIKNQVAVESLNVGKEDQLDTKAQEQLARVHVELHQFYNRETHTFELPATLIIKNNGDMYFLFIDGKLYEEEFFLDNYNIHPEDICLLQEE